MVLSSAYVLKENTPFDEINYPLCIATVAVDHLQEAVYRPDGTNLYQCFFCYQGEGKLHLDGKNMIIRPGTGFFIKKNIPHSYQGKTGEWYLDVVGFDGCLCEPILQQMKMDQSGIFLFGKYDFREMVKNIYRAVEEYPQDISALSKIAYSFLVDMAEHVNHIYSGESARDDKIIGEVYHYLEKNYADTISLVDIAEYVSISKEYLCSYFKKKTGQTIMNALLDIRIKYARIFLNQYPEKKVYEIARMCGFESASYFCQVFKRREKMTPDAFRKR